jgi:RNA polymerase sigma-70 factor, ECF subfamily
MSDKDKKEKQFLEAYNKFSDAIFRHCYYCIFDREEAKDFTQETFLRAWKYLSEGKEVKNIRAFLYKIANNIIIDNSRKKKSISLDQIIEKGFSPKIDEREKTENYFSGKEIIKIINSLDGKYRDVIVMKYIDDLSSKEIASILDETENNVYVMIHRGFDKVRKILEEQEK